MAPNEALLELLSKIYSPPWEATRWGIRCDPLKYLAQKTDATYGSPSDYQLMALAPELAVEVIKLREEVAALKERIVFCSGSCRKEYK